MRAINVDDDIYEFLLKNTKEIGESASDILRRLLGLSGTATHADTPIQGEHELSAALSDPRFARQTAAVDRFLYVLSVAYAQKKDAFEKILNIQGRERKYFAKSEAEIEASGQSTQPRNIPGSPYWAMTNSTTPQKRETLIEALTEIGYSAAAIKAAAATLG